MPLAIAALLLNLLCCVHVVRSGRPRAWLFVILGFPVVGCLAYAAAEILPELLNGPEARRAREKLRKSLDPDGDCRAAQDALADSPTAENRIRLADALVERGDPAAAVAHYRAALGGLHAEDPATLHRLARAEFCAGALADALATLARLEAASDGRLAPDAELLRARTLEGLERTGDALAAYAALAERYPGEEARCRYALLLKRCGRTAEAETIFAELRRRARRAPRHHKAANREWFAIAAREGAA